jgi:hypothetical protein
MLPVFCDQWFHAWQFADLTTRWLRIIAQKERAALPATDWTQIDDMIDSLNWQQPPSMTLMAGLPARFAPRLFTF